LGEGRRVRIITVGGTEGKRDLSRYLRDGIAGSRLLAPEGGDAEPGGASAVAFPNGGRGGMLPGRDIEVAIGKMDMSPEGGTLVLESNAVFSGLEPELALFYIDVPLENLPESVREAGGNVDMALVEVQPGAGAAGELGLEGAVKKATGAGKVLIFGDAEGRERAFRKVLDVALSRLEGSEMPEDIPEKVVDAVKREADEGRMTCTRAHELAGELGVPVSLVGRALDLLGIKITRCQLGCF
jgi:hypothetical protein